MTLICKNFLKKESNKGGQHEYARRPGAGETKGEHNGEAQPSEHTKILREFLFGTMARHMDSARVFQSKKKTFKITLKTINIYVWTICTRTD